MASQDQVGFFSIQNKIVLAMVVISLLILVTVIGFSQHLQTQLVDNVVSSQVRDSADSYFDSINILMLTGTIQNREMLQKELLARPGVVEARIIRSPALIKTFGAGNADQKPEDNLDQRALAGEFVEEFRSDNGQRLLTVVNPMKATKDYRGTNCLTCHIVEEGTVLGAVRVSYSLDELDAQVKENALTTFALLLVIFSVGVLLMIIVLRLVVISPINSLTSTIHKVEYDSDLNTRVRDIKSNDEVGIAGRAFNSMIEKFHQSLQHVSDTTSTLTQEADHIKAATESTAAAVIEQRSRTDSIATAVNEMEHSAHEVKSNAEHTAEASHEANQRAIHGQSITEEAIQAIRALSSSVTNAAEVIHKLDEQSQSVGAVLDVIRGISEQTNLLALNAAIEAARAGEMGRGFAVVADEVRTLASKTHESTEEIQQMIEELQKDARNAVGAMEQSVENADHGVNRVQDAVSALNDIVQQAERITALNTQMATAAEEQSYVSEEINRNITDITQIADSTADEASQTTRVSENLVRLANQLEAMVQKFKL
jgi:methyl-accepting chemotaxis protein